MPRTRLLFWFSAALLLLGLFSGFPGGTPAVAQEPAAVVISREFSRAAEVDALVRSAQEKARVPGIALAVVQDGKLVYSRGYGVADREKEEKVTPQTIFRLGSISKTFTAVAAMRLWEDGKLDLDAPVQKYVPTFPEKPEGTITARLLLGHLAGIRHYRGQEILSVTHYTDAVAPLVIFKDDPLLHPPGAKYEYSTYGFNLLGAAIQGAAGDPFVEVVRKTVFAKAGMPDAGVDDITREIPRRATGYLLVSDQLFPAPRFDATNKIPGGGFLGTAPDLAAFIIALWENRLLKAETVALMWSPQQTSSGTRTDYGLGWHLTSFQGERVVAHGGGQPGVSTMLWTVPERKFAVILLTNLSAFRAADLAKALTSTLLKPGNGVP